MDKKELILKNGLVATIDPKKGSISMNREVNQTDLVMLSDEIKDLINVFAGVASQRADQGNANMDNGFTKGEIKAIRRFTKGFGPTQQSLNQSLERVGFTEKSLDDMGL